MNTTIRGLAVSLSIGVCSVAIAAPKSEQVRVAASQELRVAVVDSTKASATRDALHQTFAASLSTSLTRQCGGPVGVKVKCVGADNAAFNLGAGVYDAVLVIGRAVPDKLRRIDSILLSATPEGGKRDRVLYLVIANGDTSLQGLLAAAFTGTVNDGKFLASYNGIDGKLVNTSGEKLATAQ
jgi:hypothetical protein